MPEGPTIILFREELLPLTGHRVSAAGGAIKSIDPSRLDGHRLNAIDTWGKYLYLLFDGGLSLRLHFGMFGVFYFDEERPGKTPKLLLEFSGGTVLRFYATSMKYNQPLPAKEGDFVHAADLMSPAWSPVLVLKKLRALPPAALICDALLDQTLFAGLGNIIKNEALFRSRIQPESRVAALPAKRLRQLVDEAHRYAHEFLHWRREGTLRQHWEAHNQKTCPRCGIPFVKAYTGELQRRSYYCRNCMHLYT